MSALISAMVSLLIGILILLNQGPTVMTVFNLNYFFRDPISNYSHLGLGFQHMNVLEGHKHSVHNRLRFLCVCVLLVSFFFFTSLLEYNCFTMMC